MSEELVTKSNDGGTYDTAGNSAHYQSNFMQYVREQERKYGTVVAYLTCIVQIDRYSQRVGLKSGVDPIKDVVKKKWYHTVAQHFKAKIIAQHTAVVYDEAIYGEFVELAPEVLALIEPELKNRSIPKNIIKLEDIAQ
jgi:hypothetical protein